MSNAKPAIVTFKVDDQLWEALRGIENRSEFIRHAVLNALGHDCPLCKGTGVLTPQQRRHWDAFLQHHDVRVCGDCAAVHLVCEAEGDDDARH